MFHAFGRLLFVKAQGRISVDNMEYVQIVVDTVMISHC